MISLCEINFFEMIWNRLITYIRFIVNLIQSNEDFNVVNHLIISFNEFMTTVNWEQLLRLTFLMVMAMSVTVLLDVLSEKIIDRFQQRRIRRHHMTITNNGNFSSLFLLRSIDNPKTMGMRFYSGDDPMIWVTYAPQLNKQQEQETASETKPQIVDEGKAKMSDNPPDLVPDLSDPLGEKKKQDAVTLNTAAKTVTTEINKVGRHAGFFASIFSSIATLLPVKNPMVQDAQKALKGIQEDATQMAAQLNTRVNAVNTLGDQIGKIPQMGQTTQLTQGMMNDAMNEIKNAPLNLSNIPNADVPAEKNEFGTAVAKKNYGNYLSADFSYDEETWLRNIGKVDENDGALIFAQTGIIKPGESLKIDVELMNLSENKQKVSHMYKIEVRQIMMSDLNISAPERYINGIVIFERISIMERVGPGLIVAGLAILAIHLIILLSVILF